MNVFEQLTEDMKSAMKSHDDVKRDCINMNWFGPPPRVTGGSA